MAEIYLDQENDVPLADGFCLITSEVEFLRMAISGANLHIRGESLCEWAETFYLNRNIRFKITFSIKREIEQTIPELTRDNINDLLNKYGDRIRGIGRPISIEKVLNAIYPSPLWSTPYSTSHLAEWLIWVYKTQPPAEIQNLMRLITGRWAAAVDKRILDIYQGCLNRDCAEEALANWLGILNRDNFPLLEEFPMDVPNEIIQRARDEWNLKIIATHGKFLEQLDSLSIPYKVKMIAAKETFRYFLQNSGDLQSRNLVLLSKYLGFNEINELRKRLHPDFPKELPDTPEQVAEWYVSEYLPYREWQASNSNSKNEQIIKLANQFSRWYLENYPKALSGAPLQKWVSFYRTAHIELHPNLITLVVVLDGLHLSDARTLLQKIRAITNRLSTINEEVAFSPIPTITQFAKEALFYGVPPDKVNDVQPVGIILPEDKSPAQRLVDTELGSVYIWRVLEPDRTYHQKNRSENLLQDVSGRLEAEALKIKEIVETIPEKVLLQIIITTDHGRLLGNSDRSLPLPSNLESHGRVAWGDLDQDYLDQGWCEKDKVFYLSGQRFGLPHDMAISVGEESFVGNDNRGGREAFPHGGLFPEEVIIPWIVFSRDAVRPRIDLTLSGEGKARGNGTLVFQVINMSDIELTVKDFVLRFRNGSERRIEINQILGSRQETRIERKLDSWPSPSELSALRGYAKIIQPNGLSFDYSIMIDIKSKDIYDRGENILEDL